MTGAEPQPASGLAWSQLEDELVAATVAAVRRTVGAHPAEHFRAAAMDEIYAETCGPIWFGTLQVVTDEDWSRMERELGEPTSWSTADWAHQIVDWLPDARVLHWQAQLAVEAGLPPGRRDFDGLADDVARWEGTYRRFLTMLATVARRTRASLIEAGATDDTFLVVVLDPDQDERLLSSCLRPGELERWFPEAAEALAGTGIPGPPSATP